MGPRLLLVLLVLLAGLNVYQYARAPSPDPDEVRDRFQRLFDDTNRVLTNKWFGVQTSQHPFDVWIQQEIIFEVKPDFIVETGTHLGGSAVLWATILEHANAAGRIITIDIEDKRDPRALKQPVYQRRVEFLHGSSTDPAIVAEVARRVHGKQVLVILDSAKQPTHVLSELRAYAPLVSIGSYLIVQDTHLGYRVPHWRDEAWAPGPLAAVEEFIETTDAFVIDTSRERLIATNNPNGFLKRIR